MNPIKARLLFYGAVLLVSTAAVAYTTAMPGRSFSGPLPEPTSELKLLEGRLRGHVNALATDIGVRNWEHAAQLAAARDYIRSVLAPLESAEARTTLEDLGSAGQGGQNVVFEISGAEATSLLVVGAHYDSAHVSPGANDNASGVAAALELARSLARAP
ncbi:MAG TPA: M28 family peptidase, partial [Polyangiaceae bacterium]|nr:M28 family peptidase [Polyangiaceae bacterium]